MNNTFNFLSSIKGVSVNPEFVEDIKKCLHPTSKSVDMNIKTDQNLLGIKIDIVNHGSFNVEHEGGVDVEFLDAIFAAMCGDMEYLNNYSAEDKYVSDTKGVKMELLDKLFEANIPCSARKVTISDGKKEMFEIMFLLNFKRKVRLYFPTTNTNVVETLRGAGVIE